jgi:hypothetical protein
MAKNMKYKRKKAACRHRMTPCSLFKGLTNIQRHSVIFQEEDVLRFLLENVINICLHGSFRDCFCTIFLIFFLQCR